MSKNETENSKPTKADLNKNEVQSTLSADTVPESVPESSKAVSAEDSSTEELSDVMAAKASETQQMDINHQDDNNDEEGNSDNVAEVDSNVAMVRLSEVVGVDQLESLHSELRAVFENSPVSIEIDAEDVEVIDFCGAQLLASFTSKAASQGIKVNWENVSIPVFQTATELDLCQVLGL